MQYIFVVSCETISQNFYKFFLPFFIIYDVLIIIWKELVELITKLFSTNSPLNLPTDFSPYIDTVPYTNAEVKFIVKHELKIDTHNWLGLNSWNCCENATYVRKNAPNIFYLIIAPCPYSLSWVRYWKVMNRSIFEYLERYNNKNQCKFRCYYLWNKTFEFHGESKFVVSKALDRVEHRDFLNKLVSNGLILQVCI